MDIAHRLDRVHDQVEKHLLQLDTIPRHARQRPVDSVRRTMSWLRSSRSVSATTSRILRLRSSNSMRGTWRFVSARMRAMTSRARLPSAVMLSSAKRASAMSGGSAASQRAPAAASPPSRPRAG